MSVAVFAVLPFTGAGRYSSHSLFLIKLQEALCSNVQWHVNQISVHLVWHSTHIAHIQSQQLKLQQRLHLHLNRTLVMAVLWLMQMLLRGVNAVGYTSYADNVVNAFVKEARVAGVDIFRVFDSLNYIDNLKFGIDSVHKGGGVAEGTLCYTGDVSNPSKRKVLDKPLQCHHLMFPSKLPLFVEMCHAAKPSLILGLLCTDSDCPHQLYVCSCNLDCSHLLTQQVAPSCCIYAHVTSCVYAHDPGPAARCLLCEVGM